ncbi:MAG: hypothetical protein HKO06_08630 [Pseudomonadales bacterium]|nr:hypothetical protein [Pseudomonadales bacterium]
MRTFNSPLNHLRHDKSTILSSFNAALSALVTVLSISLLASSAQAQLIIFETPGITLGDDAVECIDQVTYRECVSDVGSERILSHNGQPVAERTPLDFKLLLPQAPAVGDDGNYPLVVFIHGWNGNKNSTGGGVESEHIPYVEAGYAVLAYSARGWGGSCGSAQQLNPECSNGWNHLADARYEVRDTQYITGLLADELSDDGTPLIDPMRIGVTGVSYGGGQSTILTSLRNRVVETDGTVNPWLSPAGKPMQIAAAAPYWAWTDLTYSLAPNGRNLDYVSNNSYFGPAGVYPFGILKESYVTGLYGTGNANSNYAESPDEPPLTQWYTTLLAGEPYTVATAKPIADEIIAYHSGYYWLDPEVEPAPTLFNSGWSDDLFPVDEPLRWIHAVNTMHPNVNAALYATNYGHARASSVDAGIAKASVREWFDFYLMDIGEEPGPVIRAKVQDCDSSGTPTYVADRWSELMLGEIRFEDAVGGIVTSSSSPSANATQSFDPITGGNACARVNDSPITGGLVYDLPMPDTGGYTVLGSPTIIADITVTGVASESMLVARLLDVSPNGTELLLARGAYRPDASGVQVFQMHPIAARVHDDHHLQVEILGHENPTHRQSNSAYTLTITDIDVRVPVAERPNNMQINKPAEKLVPAGLVSVALIDVAVPAISLLGLGFMGAFLLQVAKRARRN